MKKLVNTKNVRARMARLIVLKSFLLITGLVSAQDIITFTTGNSVEAVISEITPTDVKYRRYGHTSGPLYTVRLSRVHTIRYEDGLVEEYNPSRAAQERSVEASKKSKKSTPKIDDNGFFVDGLIGITSYTFMQESTVPSYSYLYGYETVTAEATLAAPMIGMRMGSKFYLSNKEKKFVHGFQMNWLTIQAVLGRSAGINMQLINPGYTSILKLDATNALELNVSTGLSMLGRDFRGDSFGYLPVFNFQPYLGANINPGIKFRHNGFALGIDYTYMTTLATTEKMQHGTFNFSIGRKF